MFTFRHSLLTDEEIKKLENVCIPNGDSDTNEALWLDNFKKMTPMEMEREDKTISMLLGDIPE